MGIMEQIEIAIDDRTGNNIPSQLVTITKAYNDKTCDINTNKGLLRNVRCSGVGKVGDEALLVYEDGNSAKPFVLLFADLSDYYTKEEIDEIIAGGSVDLKNYVKKVDLIDNTKYDIDLNLSFGLSGIDDTIEIDMDIVDHIVSKTINIGG